MQSLDDMSQAAKTAYQAFIDMKQSKTAHFSCLEALEAKYEAGGAPSLAENVELEKLLANHDKNVLAFKTAMTQVSDDAEKQALVKLLT